MIAAATQRAEKDAAQRKDENTRLRATMQDFAREFEGTVGVWRSQWKDIKITSEMNKKRRNKQAAKEMRRKSNNKSSFNNSLNNSGSDSDGSASSRSSSSSIESTKNNKDN